MIKNKSILILICTGIGFALANVPGALIGAGIAMYCVEKNIM